MLRLRPTNPALRKSRGLRKGNARRNVLDARGACNFGAARHTGERNEECQERHHHAEHELFDERLADDRIIDDLFIGQNAAQDLAGRFADRAQRRTV